METYVCIRLSKMDTKRLVNLSLSNLTDSEACICIVFR